MEMRNPFFPERKKDTRKCRTRKKQLDLASF